MLANEKKCVKRIAWPDMLKGIAVLLVAVGHNPKVSSPIVHWIYSFHIPAFFFVAGYFWKLKDDSIIKTFLIRAKQILPIYFAMSLAMLVMDSVVNRKLNLDMLIGTFIVWMTKYSGYLWFLPCFLMFSLIFSAIGKWLKNIWLGFIAAIVLAVIIFYIRAKFMIRLPLDIDVAIVMLPFGFIGRALRYFMDEKNAISDSRWWQKIVVGACFLIAQIVLCIKHAQNGQVPHIDYNLMATGNTLVAYLAGIAGVLGISAVLMALPEIKVLSFAGRYSIVFYCMCWIGSRNFFSGAPIAVNVMISTFAMYLVSMLVVALLNKVRPGLLK